MDVASLVAPLVGAPRSTAILLDVDGTLAPIVPRPELARVPPEVQAELRRLARRYLLVACLSGRSGEEAARLVAVEEVRCIGNHGLELAPGANELARDVARFRDRIVARWPVEDKRLSLSLHYREASDEKAALDTLRRIAADAEAAGLDARFGRKVLEIRPRVHADKGTAAGALLAESGAELALYAGDDTTDLDAFRGLEEASLRVAVRVAVSSPETPGALLDRADLVVQGPDGVLGLLREL